MTALYVALAFLSGAYVGATLTRWKWESNWREPFRIESHGMLFKVHRCDERASESFANLRPHILDTDWDRHLRHAERAR